MCAYRPSPTSALSSNSQSITNCQLPIARLLDSIHHRPLPPTAINSKHFIPQQSFGIPPKKTADNCFPLEVQPDKKKCCLFALIGLAGHRSQLNVPLCAIIL